MAKISKQSVVLDDPDEDENPLDLPGLTQTLLRNSWLIVLVAVLAALAAWIYTRKMPDLYRATAVIQIETREQKPIALQDPIRDAMSAQDNLLNPEVVETIIERFRSRSLMERVDKALGLATNARFLGYQPARPVDESVVVSALLSGSSAVMRTGTRLVDVSFTHPDPDLAYKVANALVDQFLKQGIEQRAEMLETQNRVLTEKSQELKDKVTRSELDLQEYEKKLNSVSLEDRHNLVEEKLRGLNADLTIANGERLRLESDAKQSKLAEGSTEQLLTIPSVSQDAQVTAAQARLDKEEENMTALAQRYGPLHPRMIEEKAELEAARQGVTDAVRTAPDRIASRYAAARAREEGLRQAVQEQESALLDMDAKVIPFRALQREYDSNRTLFESVLQQLKQSTLQLGVQSVDFRIVEPAVGARRAPNLRPLIVAAAAVLAGGFTGGILLLLFFIRQGISTVESAERLLKLPVLAAVPRMRSAEDFADTISAMERAGSPEAESFRTLRTALQLLASDSKQVILISSAIPSEGKSVVSANIAAAYAQLGLRTLLVEADLRRPSLDELFAVPGQESRGLGEYLDGEPIRIAQTKQEGLDFLFSGGPLKDPAKSLAGPQFGQLIEQIKPEYDRIVIDTAPINVVSDTLNIVGCASIICLVVRCDSTPRKVVQRTIELLRRAGVRPDGMVLNCVVAWSGRKYPEYYQRSGSAKAGEDYSKPLQPAMVSAFSRSDRAF
jgi:capsular exopolysaccharide synthesis family protein